MITSSRKLKIEYFISKYPEIVSNSNSSEVEFIKKRLETRITGTVAAKTNTVISTPSKFIDQIYPPVYPTNVITNLVQIDCKVVKKNLNAYRKSSV